MDNKPSLSQYFGATSVPPSQFFDEIGTSPSDMIQSVYLGDSEGAPSSGGDLFSQTVTSSPSETNPSEEATFSNVVTAVSAAGTPSVGTTSAAGTPSVGGASAAGTLSLGTASVAGTTSVPATSLPDPSTFFDTIGPDPQLGIGKSGIASPNMLTEAMDGLNVKNQPVDKEADRRRDAWIPDEETKKILMKVQSSPKGSFFPEREVLTMPGIVLEEELADGLQEVSVRYLGVCVAGARGVLRAEHVSRDEAGLRELLRTGYTRAALNLTAALLTAAHQGAGRMHRPGRHSARTLQLWLCRLALLLRLRLLEPLQREAEPFGDLGKPDMYYQFYPESGGGGGGARGGSLAPFSLRLLLAELPQHAGRAEDALRRLYHMLAVIRQMLSNVREGRTEDGAGALSSEQDKLESLRLWTARETRVWHSVVNCAIAMKDYRQAGEVLEALRRRAASGAQRRALSSALCRLWLLAGHVRAAAASLQRATAERHHICPTPDVREYVDLGLVEVAAGNYQDAYNKFARAADQEPTNIMVANNLAVCLLYMGRLKEAIAVLQKAINSDPERGLNESLLLNLCTLYELESSNTNEKKLNLLRMLCKYKSDTIPNVAECLKLAAVAR